MHKPLTFRTEELIEVKLVKLTLHCYFTDAVGQLVRHHHHAGQGGVRVVLSRKTATLKVKSRKLFLETLFRFLFIGVRPVENLLFNELTRSDSTERGAAEIEIRTCSKRHQLLVVILNRLTLFFLAVLKENTLPFVYLLNGYVLFVVKLFGTLAPCSEMVFV